MKLFEQFRIKRRKIYDGLFGAQALFVAGLIIMPALLFAPNVLFRILFFLFFWFLAWLSGRKNNPLFTILVIFFIITFNLIFPYGQVLHTIGAFRITAGALMLGINRAITLTGLLMLSRVIIRRDLKIPGLFGELIAESFRLLSELVNRKQRLTRKNLIRDIDNIMIELSESSEKTFQPDAAPASRTKPAGFIILGFIIILSWLPIVSMLVLA